MKRKQLKKVFPFLKILEKLSSEDQTIIIDYLNDEGCCAIFECIANVLHNTKITGRKKLKKDLIDKKSHLRYVINGKKSMKGRRKRLKQVGGSLALILGTVLPILANFLSG